MAASAIPVSAVSTGDHPAVRFTPVAPSRASAAVVEQIRLLIREGRLTPGDRLPSERRLCQEFAISRLTLREALRVLESAGLLRVRVGRGGGAFVTAPSPDPVGTGLTDLLTVSHLDPAHLTEARRVLELAIVPLVCERATEQDIAELTVLCQEAERAQQAGTHSVELSARFHVRVATCSHNDAMALLVEGFRGALLESLSDARAAAPELTAAGHADHVAFVAAVRARDAALATGIMERHLRRSAAHVEARCS